jgi:hypothetical protein
MHIFQPSYAETDEPSIEVLFDKCASRKTDLLSLFRSSFNGSTKVHVIHSYFFNTYLSLSFPIVHTNTILWKLQW